MRLQPLLIAVLTVTSLAHAVRAEEDSVPTDRGRIAPLDHGLALAGAEGVAASTTLPLSHGFTSRLDEAFGDIEGTGSAALAGHLLWRPSPAGLLGLTAAQARIGARAAARAALEAGVRTDGLSVFALAGYQATGGVDTPYGEVAMRLPLGERLLVDVSARAARAGRRLGTAVNLAPTGNRRPPWRFFFEGVHETPGGTRVLGGIRVFFGPGGASGAAPDDPADAAPNAAVASLDALAAQGRETADGNTSADAASGAQQTNGAGSNGRQGRSGRATGPSGDGLVKGGHSRASLHAPADPPGRASGENGRGRFLGPGR